MTEVSTLDTHNHTEVTKVLLSGYCAWIYIIWSESSLFEVIVLYSVRHLYRNKHLWKGKVSVKGKSVVLWGSEEI